MRLAKEMYDHAEELRVLLAEFAGRSELSRTRLVLSRNLFDTGAAALTLMSLADDDSNQPQLPVRRGPTTASLEDDALTVDWGDARQGGRVDGYASNLAVFGSLMSLLDSLYRAQMMRRSVFVWGDIKIKIGEDPFKLEQFARALVDAAVDLLELARIRPTAAPILAIAARIDEPPVAAATLDDLREVLRVRSDEWSRKPNLVRRRRPLQGRVRFTG